MKVTIVAADGRTLPLDGSEGVYLGRGWEGLVAPTAQVETDPAVGRQGGRLRRVRVEPRDVDIPVLVAAKSRTELRDRLRKLTGFTDPRRGDARLRVEHDDGETADLVGRVAEVVASGGDGNATHQPAELVWRAPDPYWRGDEVIREYKVSAPDFFGDDGFPLRLAGATIIATVSEDNVGDADAWPYWLLRGPGVPRIENETTGHVIEFDDLTLDDGEELVIDTEPGVKTVELDGESIYDHLTLDSTLFALQPGVNVLNVDLDDGTDDSLVRLRYRPRRIAP